ncbi:MAG: NrfD/PsrC family molybdoenzyme membrane anchor subunit [Akkermansia sp.]
MSEKDDKERYSSLDEGGDIRNTPDSHMVRTVVAMAESQTGVVWRVVFIVCLSLAVWGLGFGSWRIAMEGVGVMGVSNNVPWGLDIVHFVFWVGLGHAGTLISSVLLLTGQHWRSPIARGAELMTLCAVVCAAIFPFVHVGRIWMAWMVSPLPDVSGIWANIGSVVVWDVLAVGTYLLLSVLYWYVGLLPDLAVLRDRCVAGWRRRLYGVVSLGWMGTSRQWGMYERGGVLLAAVLTPLVVSVHSIVSFDFAVTQNHGWHETIFPPYFVAGAILSGMAMVQLILVTIRRVYGKGIGLYLDGRILGMTGRFVLGLSLVMGMMYFWEVMVAFLNGGQSQMMMMARLFGHDASVWWVMLVGNVLLPQLYWFKRWRRCGYVIVPVALGVLVGMWSERWLIVVHSLEQAWRAVMDSTYCPTWVDGMMGLGSFGLFVVLYMVLMRVTPFFSLCEMRLHQEGQKNQGERGGL